eukprot:388889-Rhodomonas_salina.2
MNRHGRTSISSAQGSKLADHDSDGFRFNMPAGITACDSAWQVCIILAECSRGLAKPEKQDPTCRSRDAEEGSVRRYSRKGVGR